MHGLSQGPVPSVLCWYSSYACQPGLCLPAPDGVGPSPLYNISDVNPMGAKQGTPGALRGHVSSCSSCSRSRSSRSRASRCLWRGWDAVQWYLLSPHFQLGVQLAGGIILTSLPVFVRWGRCRFERGGEHWPPQATAADACARQDPVLRPQHNTKAAPRRLKVLGPSKPSCSVCHGPLWTLVS